MRFELYSYEKKKEVEAMSDIKAIMNKINNLKPLKTKNCSLPNLSNSQILSNAMANKFFNLLSNAEIFVSLLDTFKEIIRIQSEREIELEKINSMKEITIAKLRKDYEISMNKILSDLEKYKEYTKACNKVIDKALESNNFDEAIKVLNIWKDILKEKMDSEV